MCVEGEIDKHEEFFSKARVKRMVFCSLVPTLLVVAVFYHLIKAQLMMADLIAVYQDLTTTWRDDAVFDFRSSITYFEETMDAHQLAYSTPWSGSWPGTVEGSDCRDSAFFFWKPHESSVRGGRSLLAWTGDCKHYPATSAQTLTKWKGSETFVLRMKNTSFLSVYQNMNQDGSCKPGFQHCGKKKSVGKGYCIPESIPNCPVTKLYQTFVLGSASVATLVERKNDDHPITFVSIDENTPCFDRSRKPLTKDRKPYELLNANYEHCIPDETATRVSGFSLSANQLISNPAQDKQDPDEMGEKALFDTDTCLLRSSGAPAAASSSQCSSRTKRSCRPFSRGFGL